MAQETKVGLLAGLAFIVCFAVILTNRGNERFGSEDFSLPPDLPSTQTASGSQRATDSHRIAQSESRAPQAGWQRPAYPSDAIRQADPTTATHPDLRTPPKPTGVIAEANGAARNRAGSIADPTGTAALRDRLEGLLDELAANVRDQRSANAGHAHEAVPGAPDSIRPWTESPPAALSAPSARQQASPRGMQYTVVSGDSLSKIARLFYGTGSRTVVNAIFDANRAVLPSIDQLRAGLRITLPTVAGISGPRGDSANPEAAPPAVSQPNRRRDESQPQNTQWYEIQKNDRYAKIAREQLGDESRWREIFELNKDKFPKPDMIRPGVRIRLPGRRVASAGDGRH